MAGIFGSRSSDTEKNAGRAGHFQTEEGRDGWYHVYDL